ncbi:hypothetical protein H0H81_008022 [Sphagnurus paluster]|uniref:Uncharacterized protein n=1 Tax=Sphagnurus paluster TaxID=117069 RepID=A0A9P7GJ56_9AGAR|nr:hypothetical protein H0H81_008022 [Sphagnurus paluster]
MATVLERPVSALSARPQQQPPLVEIIDVDLLDDPAPTLQRTVPETISLLDSDEDDHVQQRPVASSSRRRGQSSAPDVRFTANTQQHTVSRRNARLFSPPPPATPGPSNPPPVPRLPRGLLSFASLPRRPAAPSPPVVRPIEQPLAFEQHLRPPSPPAAAPQHPNRHRRGAPRHIHIPSMGLGGALTALNLHRRMPPDHDPDAAQQPRNLVWHHRVPRMPNLFERAGTTLQQQLRDMMQRVDDGDDELGFEHPFRLHRHIALAQGWGGARREHHQQQQPEEGKYRPEYTHPTTPEPGFTFDFAPAADAVSEEDKSAPIVIDLSEDDVEAQSPQTASSVQTILVCAQCLDPLVQGGGLVGDEARRRKVWALRCGHMIDGKCLEVLGAPPQEEAEAEAEENTGSKGKGKGKGKGKAPVYSDDESDDDHADAHVQVQPAPENPMRARLRSRSSTSASKSTSASTSTAPTASSTALGKRKRERAPPTAKRRLSAIHEWSCPVAGCARIHASVHIAGAWVPEPDLAQSTVKGKARAGPGRGVVAMFV